MRASVYALLRANFGADISGITPSPRCEIGHLVFKTVTKNFYKLRRIKILRAKIALSKNCQKFTEMRKNAQVLVRNDQEMRAF